MNNTSANETVTEIEVFYRGLAMMGLVVQGWDLEVVPELAKSLASRMMEDSEPEVGLAAVKPKRKYNRK